MKKTVFSIIAAGLFTVPAFAQEAVLVNPADQHAVVRVQVAVDKKAPAMIGCWVSKEPADTPPMPPEEVDCNCVEIPAGSSTLVIKMTTEKSLETAVEILKVMAGKE